MATPTDPKPAEQPDHSMNQEEPLGWDQAPNEDTPDADKRHPRQDGKGGTPNHELPLEEAQGQENDGGEEEPPRPPA